MPLLVCPNCNVGMSQVKRLEVELDVCPQCRGVWLDRGELEKLLQPLREQTKETANNIEDDYERQVKRSGFGRDYDKYRHEHDDDHGHNRGHRDRYGRKRGWRNILDVLD